MANAAVAGFGEAFGEEKAAGATALWHRAHEKLVRLAATRAGLDYEEGRWLLRAERSGVHLRLGYASFREYVERLFGYSPRLVQEKLRVAAALEELPVLSAELQRGRMSFSAVRELTRVATAATDRAWLEAARGRSIREVEGLVSGHKPGSLPEDAPDSAEIIEMAACDGQNVGHVGEVGHAHVGETTHAHVGASLPRATQTIPPALRRRVMRRDGGRCRVPGCRHAVFVDVHHLELRSEGGRNTLENLVTLCAAQAASVSRAPSSAGEARRGPEARRDDP